MVKVIVHLEKKEREINDLELDTEIQIRVSVKCIICERIASTIDRII